MKLRLYELWVVAALVACGWGGLRAVWLPPGETLRDVPKNVRNNPGSYRSHYRNYVYIGGK